MPMEEDELDDYIDTLINEELNSLIEGDIGLSTCQFFKEDNSKTAILLASGVLVELGSSCYILTASHVIEDWSNDNNLFIAIDDDFISIIGRVYGTEMDKDNRLDMAHIKLTPKLVSILRSWYRFIPVQRMLHHNKSLLDANYCIFGYPVINQKQMDGKTKTFGSAYFCKPSQDTIFEYYGLNPLVHYVFEFQGKSVNIKSNKLEKIRTDYYGLSGSGVWYTDIQFKRNKLKSSAHLVGTMIEFRKGKYECLIGNRIEIILATIQHNEGIKIKRTY